MVLDKVSTPSKQDLVTGIHMTCDTGSDIEQKLLEEHFGEWVTSELRALSISEELDMDMTGSKNSSLWFSFLSPASIPGM